MIGSKTSAKWTEAGYELFAKEGPDGIRVERLARILNLNKSGFYHFFGDMVIFAEQLVRHHYNLVELFLDDVAKCQNVDPEYLYVLVKHKMTIMGQIRLVQNKSNPSYYGAHKEADDKVVRIAQRIWVDHINIHNNPRLVAQYHGLVRDMLYSRISWEKFNYDYLQNLVNEAKEVVSKIQGQKKV